MAQAAQEEHRAARDRALQAAHAQASLLEAQDARMALDGNEAAQLEAEEEMGASAAALHANIHALDSSLLLADSLGSAAAAASKDHAAAGLDGLFRWDEHPNLGPAFGALVDQIKSVADSAEGKKTTTKVLLPVVELDASAGAAAESDAKAASSDKKKKSSSSKKDKQEAAPMDVDEEAAPAVAKKSKKTSSKSKQ